MICRIIKFRMWDKKNEVWIINFSIKQDGALLNSDDAILDKERYILTQFTGLYDKNGKEIYESDLIKHQNVSEPLEVYWCNATGQWKLRIGEYRHYYGLLHLYPNNFMEVMGNIYECKNYNRNIKDE